MSQSNVESQPQKAISSSEQRQAHTLHPHHAHNRGAVEQTEQYDKYKEEYTLLPSQKIFKIEKHDPYERDEIIRQNKLNRELEERRQNRLLSSQEEAKNKQNQPDDGEISKPSFLGAKDRPIQDENDPSRRIPAPRLGGGEEGSHSPTGEWQEEMDNQQIDHFAELMNNLKPQTQRPMESLANSAEDGQGMDKESNVRRDTFVHGFSEYQQRYAEPIGMPAEPDDYTFAQPKVFNPTIIQGSSNPGG